MPRRSRANMRFSRRSIRCSFNIEAIYENGVLKPAQPLPLEEHETVCITIEPQHSWAERTAGILQWKGDFEEHRRIVEDDESGIREPR